jgi:hypothetical protein
MDIHLLDIKIDNVRTKNYMAPGDGVTADVMKTKGQTDIQWRYRKIRKI